MSMIDVRDPMSNRSLIGAHPETDDLPHIGVACFRKDTRLIQAPCYNIWANFETAA
jgi:hypothetical protein